MSRAACETIIWGDRLQGNVATVKNLLSSGEVVKDSRAGDDWLRGVNVILGQASEDLQKFIDNLPTV